ncbi:hypothetical protein [Streptomyces sp. NPDC001536]|uniref:hypothetical protein n=1 Tax=Streptomyces sp. NPDC001536 TaxID=3364583 RepID=UPI00369AD50B
MSASVSSPRVGVRLTGARGSVAPTFVTGHAAVTAPGIASLVRKFARRRPLI